MLGKYSAFQSRKGIGRDEQKIELEFVNILLSIEFNICFGWEIRYLFFITPS